MMVWNAVGCSTDTTWGVCTAVVLLRSPTPTPLLRLFVAVITITTRRLLLLQYPRTHSSLKGFVLFALIFQHRPIAVLRQAGFPYHAFPQLYAVGHDQAGTARQRSPERIIPNWLSKGGEVGSQVLFPHIPPVMAHFYRVFTSPFSSLFFYLPKLKPNLHSATHHVIFFPPHLLPFPFGCILRY